MLQRLALAFLASLAIGLPACGSGDEGGEPDAETVQYRRDGQALCRALSRAGRPAPRTNAVTPGAVAAELRQALDDSARFYRRLEALDVPDHLAAAEHQVLALERRDDRSWRKVVAQLRRGMSVPRAFAPHEAAIDRNRREANALYEELGLTQCVV